MDHHRKERRSTRRELLTFVLIPDANALVDMERTFEV